MTSHAKSAWIKVAECSMAERALNLNLISALLAAAWGQEEEHVVFSQNTGNLVDTRPPPFPSVLCINLVKIHPASLEKGRAEEKEGNNECWMKEWFPCFHYVSLVVPGKLWCALLLLLCDGSGQSVLTRCAGWAEKGKEQKMRKGRHKEANTTVAPSSKKHPVQTGLCDAVAAAVKPLR